MSRSVFLTGGTGFIGSHLAESLRARGYDDIRCLVRKDLKWLKGLDVTPIYGDFSKIDVLLEGVRDVDYVYHVAGVTRATSWEPFVQANVRATLNLLGAIRVAAPAVKKVLITSSLAAVGRSSQPVATEETPLNPISMYGRSKAEMEIALRKPKADASAFTDELPIVVVRPPSVYGPREVDIYTVFKTAAKGLFPIIGTGKNPDVSLVYATDLVDGMIAAAEADASVGQTYFVGSEQQYSWLQLRDAMLKELGNRALTLRVPAGLVQPVGAAVEFGARLTGSYPPLNREKAAEIRFACKMCSSEKAVAELGYRQRVSLEEGMHQTVAWYRKAGWL